MKLTEEKGECLTKELYRKLLLVKGFDWNFSRAYHHASKMFQGTGLLEIKVEHTIAMVS